MTAATWYASADEDASLPGAPLMDGMAGVAGPQKEASSVNLDTSRQRLSPGTRVGDHLIVRGVLGEGGTAIVYEALHTRLGASVALKVLDVSEEYMESAHARLRREAHVCASLEDPHIPRVYDVGELPDGTPYVVMERVSGRTLEDVLASEGPLPLDVAVHLAEDLLLAVEAIEKAGIVHRDIKPPNIILQTGGEGQLRVRLMDFGVSKNMNVDREPGLMPDPSLTQQGAIVGTPHYMAPEQIVGPSVDSRADLYAVGVVAYEMMGGRTPFEGQTTGDVVAAVLHTRPLPLRKLRDVHPALEGWVEQAMAPRRSDRFQSARVMRDALRDAWDEHLAYVTLSGRKSWMRTARVAGAVSLVGVGLALPLPAGYDLNALARLLSPQAAPEPVQAVNAAMPSATVTVTDTAPVPPASTGARGSSLPAGLPGWNHEPSSTQIPAPASLGASAPPPAMAAQALQPQTAQTEPRALNAGRVPPVPAVMPKTPGEAPSSAVIRVPGATLAMPARPVVPGVAVHAAPLARAGSATPAAVPAAEPEPVRPGVLLDEYLRQLEEQLKASPPAAHIVEEPKRAPGQPAPNPFDTSLPDNPYQSQAEAPEATP